MSMITECTEFVNSVSIGQGEIEIALPKLASITTTELFIIKQDVYDQYECDIATREAASDSAWTTANCYAETNPSRSQAMKYEAYHKNSIDWFW